MIWTLNTPKVPGKYVVKTKSLVLKTIRTMDATLSFDKNNRAIWSFKNQTFYQYLNEP